MGDLCEEFTLPSANTGKPQVATDKSESLVTSADLFNIQRPLLTNELAQGNLANLPDDDQLLKLCTDAGFMRTVAIEQYFMVWSCGMSSKNFTSR